MTKVLSFPDARQLVEQQAQQLEPGPIETVPLLEAGGRVLAEVVTADRNYPPFARSTRDGFAVRAEDVQQTPAHLRSAGEIRAGAPPEAVQHVLQTGECIEIMTGAPVPPGADAVVMVERTHRNSDGMVEIRSPVRAGENIVPCGAEARAGALLLPARTRIGYSAVAVLASVGRERVKVYRRPQVAVLCTGDELVELSATPGPHQIRNSNSYSVAAQVAAAGAVAVVLPIAPDNLEGLRKLVERGLGADLLLLTGGVSMGKYDLVEQVLEAFGAEFFITGALIQPGRPVVFGRISPPASAPGERTRYFFGLPGNPVSTMVTFELFARAIIDALAGAAPRPLHFLKARLKSDFRTPTGLTRFLPALLTGEWEASEVQPVNWQGSGDIAATARANCYLVVPPDREHFPAGEMMSVLLAGLP